MQKARTIQHLTTRRTHYLRAPQINRKKEWKPEGGRGDQGESQGEKEKGTKGKSRSLVVRGHINKVPSGGRGALSTKQIWGTGKGDVGGGR